MSEKEHEFRVTVKRIHHTEGFYDVTVDGANRGVHRHILHFTRLSRYSDEAQIKKAVAQLKRGLKRDKLEWKEN